MSDSATFKSAGLGARLVHKLGRQLRLVAAATCIAGVAAAGSLAESVQAGAPGITPGGPATVQIADAKQDAANQLFAQAFAFFKQGNYPAAEEKFQAGFKLDPDNISANYYMGQAIQLWTPGNQNSILHYYLKAAQLGPDTKDGILAEQALEAEELPLLAIHNSFQGTWCYDEDVSKHLVQPSSKRIDSFTLIFNSRNWLTAVAYWIGATRTEVQFDDVMYNLDAVFPSKEGVLDWTLQFIDQSNIVAFRNDDFSAAAMQFDPPLLLMLANAEYLVFKKC